MTYKIFSIYGSDNYGAGIAIVAAKNAEDAMEIFRNSKHYVSILTWDDVHELPGTAAENSGVLDSSCYAE